MFVLNASEIWTKSYGPNCTKYWAFWQKIVFVLNAILEDVSVAETIV